MDKQRLPEILEKVVELSRIEIGHDQLEDLENEIEYTHDQLDFETFYQTISHLVEDKPNQDNKHEEGTWFG